MKLSEIRRLLGYGEGSFPYDDLRYDLTNDGVQLEQVFPGCSVHWDRWPHWDFYFMRTKIYDRRYSAWAMQDFEPGKLARLYAILCTSDGTIKHEQEHVRTSRGTYVARTTVTKAYYSVRRQRWCVIR